MKILKSFMQKNNISQTELANKLGTTKFTLSRWMNGRNKPSLAYIRIIEQVCGKQ